MSAKARGIAAVGVLFASLNLATYAQNGGFVQDHNVPKDSSEQLRWVEYGQHYLPNPDCCFRLALDANFLWVGTSAGAVRWNLQKDTYQLFRAEDDWGMEYTQQLGMNNVATNWRSEEARQYVMKWLTNAVENIIVISAGHVWVDTYNGAMIIHGNRKAVYASVEDALAALYHTELRATLGKVVATDQKGRLWLLKKKKGITGSYELFCYDGTAWKKDKLVGIIKAEYGIKDILADSKGNLWACNAGGIYRYGEDRWEHVLKKGKYGYLEMQLGARGTLWAFGLGTLSRFRSNSWEVFEGKGRYERFRLPVPSMGQQAVVLETPDNKLWFAVFIGRAGTTGFMCFDGNEPKMASIYPIAATISPSGQAFAASGERLFRYDKGKWEQLVRPNFGLFRRPFFSGRAEVKIIEDILVAGDGTVYVATNKEGLLRYRNGSWDKMSCEKSKQEVKSIDQDAADVIAEMGEGIQSLLLELGVPLQSTIETLYNAYIEGDKKQLIKASNERLAEDVVNGKNNTSPISYYRLLARNEKLAKASLHKRIEAMCASDYGEGWLSLEIASYGPPVTEILLKIAKTGTPEQRGVAIEALGFMRDSKAVHKLLNILGDAKKLDRLSYLRLARAVIMAGNPRGMELLIEAATTEGKLQGTCRDELDRITQGYDDLPGDWSKEKWNAWWQKHKSAWRPETAYPTAMPTVMITSTHKMYQAVAEMIEKEN